MVEIDMKMEKNVKKIVTCVVSALLVGVYGMSSVHADTPPAVAIIDSGINSALFPNIVDEVCIVEWGTCSNGKQFMDGTGAANTGITTNATLTHGTEVASVVTKVNPAIKIIPIRIVGITAAGNPYIYSNNAVKQGLDWVVANRAKYNIVAVNISQGKVFDGCKVPDGTQADVDALKAANVAVIAATGNDFNHSAMDSVACLPNVISIGATDNPDPGVSGKAYDPTAKPYIARYSNGNALTSFYLNARWYTLQPNGKQKFMVGTSLATAAFTGWWTNHYQGSYAATYSALAASATVASNEWLTGKYIFVPQG
jgi:Subtilase family